MAQIQFLAGELPYAPGAALKKKEKKREGRGGKKIDVFQSLHMVCHHLFRFLLTLSAVIESFQYRGLLLHYSQIVSVFSWCEWNFFFNFLILLLQVHSSTIHSCILFLYLAVLQNSLIPSSYLVDSLVFVPNHISYVQKQWFFFSFPVFPLFYCLALLCVFEHFL